MRSSEAGSSAHPTAATLGTWISSWSTVLVASTASHQQSCSTACVRKHSLHTVAMRWKSCGLPLKQQTRLGVEADRWSQLQSHSIVVAIYNAEHLHGSISGSMVLVPTRCLIVDQRVSHVCGCITSCSSEIMQKQLHRFVPSVQCSQLHHRSVVTTLCDTTVLDPNLIR